MRRAIKLHSIAKNIDLFAHKSMDQSTLGSRENGWNMNSVCVFCVSLIAIVSLNNCLRVVFGQPCKTLVTIK